MYFKGKKEGHNMKTNVENCPKANVDYEISDRKFNQIYNAILDHSYIALCGYLRRGPPFYTIKLMILSRGPPTMK